jgi:4-hydroxy-tetrahydrodipicolinate reductase
MKIALIGYGKMGKEIEAIAKERGHEIVSVIDSTNSVSWQSITKSTTDVCIEFTHPESAFENISRCIQSGIPVVSGTTGWTQRMPEMHRLLEKENGSLFWASNFSLGVNIMFHFNKILADMLARTGQYKPSIEEIHHIHKKDAPSGTAITLAEGVIEKFPQLKSWSLNISETTEELMVRSIREDEVPGTHHVNYDSDVDRITLSHVAFSRKGFATGAVLAAEWLPGRSGLNSMNDLLKL